MKRDIGFFVPANLEQVYNAYLMAATHEPFERDCDQKPFHTISFGVNYSFKYNMNGGSCNIHFMPQGNGTAVNMRFSIAQAFGARYENYAKDLNKAMQKFLPVSIQETEYDMDIFLRPENQITPEMSYGAPAAPSNTPTVYCANCGSTIAEDNKFCSKCGTPIAPPAQKTCPNCNAPIKDGDSFCGKCGTRL